MKVRWKLLHSTNLSTNHKSTLPSCAVIGWTVSIRMKFPYYHHKISKLLLKMANTKKNLQNSINNNFLTGKRLKMFGFLCSEMVQFPNEIINFGSQCLFQLMLHRRQFGFVHPEDSLCTPLQSKDYSLSNSIIFIFNTLFISLINKIIVLCILTDDAGSHIR